MRRSSCFNTLWRITAISACAVALSAKYSHSGEIKFDQIKGDINWDDPKFLVEAQQNYQLAKEIQKDAKRRKQLRREGKTDEEVKETNCNLLILVIVKRMNMQTTCRI